MSAVEDLDDMIANNAKKLAPSAWPRHQFDSPIARAAFWTTNVGFSHSRLLSVVRTVVLLGDYLVDHVGLGNTVVHRSIKEELLP